ncbi:polysaccharide deacetylase family protein [Oceanobacillus luteolus]|uniref:Polysaccharide deacetylase family protein n=1 Tax=Oceanobacillus luteolus TaxID=1274358 RepID=A0ABW4HSM6_9BACI|nr:polysaccharide deacetylase family protein [Oceanobacillus luteolus]MCM3739886.1 polysaccharide deacetylase family protein [Oceanobacillus luteolus]
MRKFIIITLIAMLFISACNGENEQEETVKNSSKEHESEEQEEEMPAEDAVQGTEGASIDPEYYISDDATVVPITKDVNEKVVLLTFDDGPHTYSLEIAETLKKLDANAIFFVNGHYLDTPEEEEALKQLHEMGFLIGNHTYNHPLLTDISEDEQREEIVKLSDRVEEIIGERPKFFRAPNGMNTDFSEQVAAEEEMVLMNWTYGYDYFQPYMDADKLAEAMITGEGPEVGVSYSLLKPGANLLMHDREWTNEALERIVNGLREQGYEIVDPNLIRLLNEESE